MGNRRDSRLDQVKKKRLLGKSIMGPWRKCNVFEGRDRGSSPTVVVDAKPRRVPGLKARRARTKKGKKRKRRKKKHKNRRGKKRKKGRRKKKKKKLKRLRMLKRLLAQGAQELI